mgnify:FL=1
MKYTIGYGKAKMDFNIDERNLLSILYPNRPEVNLTGEDEVKRALENPIGSERLAGMDLSGKKIVIVTSDITRPMPSAKVLPHVVNELLEAGADYSDITVVFALGSHRKHTEDEKRYLAGEEIYSKIRCIDSDPNDTVRVGFSKRGTPFDIFRVVAEADFVICLGNIEYHYFAGYSGGAKAIMPGVSTRAAIQANHSSMVLPGAVTGKLEGNPVREDLEEVAGFLRIDFIVNVVLDEHKNIIKAVAGHHIEAHREGCRFLDSIYKVKIGKKADIVITTPGGYPKDINLYQAQKALDNAKHAVRDGGIIILAAACNEGLGEETFQQWMTSAASPKSIIDRIKADFRLGGHKAAAISMILENARIFLVSEMDPQLVKSIFLEPFSSLDDAVEEALKALGKDSSIIFMPAGSSTLPTIGV